MLKQNLDLNVASDKVKFLNEISKLLSNIDNSIEQEIYIEKISKGYNISKEAIFGQVNKIKYNGKEKSKTIEEKRIKTKVKKDNDKISEDILKREKMLISILINYPESYKIIKEKMQIDDYKLEYNRIIIKLLYEELEKENYSINMVIDKLESQEIQNHITAIMAEDFGIIDYKKALEDIFNKYYKEELEKRRDELINLLSMEENQDNKEKMGKELNEIILKLAKIK